MSHTPTRPLRRSAQKDRHFTLLTDADGVGYVHCGNAVAVVPFTDDGDVLLIKEYSPAFGDELLTLVSGSIEPGESLEAAANRELQEELGYRADRLDFLGELHPFKYLTTRVFIFLARELTPRKLVGDEAHPIVERRVPLAEFMQLCDAGQLHDSLAVAALALAQRFLERSADP